MHLISNCESLNWEKQNRTKYQNKNIFQNKHNMRYYLWLYNSKKW